MSTSATPVEWMSVDRRTNLSKREFDEKYLMPHQPVVISDALQHWKALGRWTPQFFQENFGDRLVNVDGSQRPLGPFMDEVVASTPEKPAPYLNNEELSALFPELVDDIQPLPVYLKPNWLNRRFGPENAQYLQRAGEPEIYIGGAGRSFPVLHCDYVHTHACLMQIYGRKQYFLYAPDQTPYMYPTAKNPIISEVNNVEKPDLERFPLFAQARGYTLTLDPGEAVFIPAGWWHTVRIVTASITISVNIANRSNWKQVRRDYSYMPFRQPKEQRKLHAYLGVIGAISRVSDLLRSR